MPALGVLGWLILFGLATVATTLVSPGEIASLVGFSVVFLGLSAAVIFSAMGAARARLRSLALASVLISGIGAVALADQIAFLPLSAVIMGAGLMLAGSHLGARLGSGIEQASHLWPLVIVALGADVWSVTTPEGITQQILANEGPVGLTLVVLTLPIPGLELSPVLGVGDVVFSGFLLGAVDTLKLSMKRTMLGLAAGFIACWVALVILAVPIPALPFIAVGAVAALGSQAKPKAKELGLAVLFVSGFFLIRAVIL